MTNTTKCPNCSSVFVISDAQYEKSKGKVRCGRCREKFYAQFMSETGDFVLSTKRKVTKETKGLFPPSLSKNELLKVLSKHAEEEKEKEENDEEQFSLNLFTPEEDVDDSFFKSTEKETKNQTKGDRLNSNIISSSDIPIIDISIPTKTLGAEDKDSPELDDDLHSRQEPSFDFTPPKEKTDQLSSDDDLYDVELRDTELIDEVDLLIKKNVLEPDTQHIEFTEQVDEQADLKNFSLNQPWQMTFRKNIKLAATLSLGLLLTVTLAYQLWLKQLLPSFLSQPISAIQNRLQPLEDNYDYSLPMRRDLNNLKLISAKTEAHPTRASTVLLKVSLLSRSNISQPLPKLELSLSDESGRLISRRTFKPNDYLYNNSTENLIASNELKKVTVELLAFPQQAHGYELRMVH